VKKTKTALLLLIILSVSITCIHVLGETIEPESNGPAPNSRDGVPDSSGFIGDWPNEDNPGTVKGPAPNYGDGIPDGSGF
jgi:hypothetical protein